jgi:adenylosuccinate synthase
LDLDHGTYPFVTSSSPTIGGVFTGTGVGPRHVERIIGVAKAYVTRVGYGPFPTEQENEVGETMGERGAEFGTTTGRKRRCGWLDGVLLRYAARVNGLTCIALTKLDVLSAFERLKICVGYSYQGKVYHDFPPHQTIFHKCLPEYLEIPGWCEEIIDARKKEELPSQALKYIEFVEQAAGVPVDVVSVGPKRTQTVMMKEGIEPPKLEEGPYLYLDEFEPPAP